MFENVGMFSLEEEDNITQIFTLHPNASIEWVMGEPPIDVPKCGFRNEKCIGEKEFQLSKSEYLSVFVLVFKRPFSP